MKPRRRRTSWSAYTKHADREGWGLVNAALSLHTFEYPGVTFHQAASLVSPSKSKGRRKRRAYWHETWLLPLETYEVGSLTKRSMARSGRKIDTTCCCLLSCHPFPWRSTPVRCKSLQKIDIAEGDLASSRWMESSSTMIYSIRTLCTHAEKEFGYRWGYGVTWKSHHRNSSPDCDNQVLPAEPRSLAHCEFVHFLRVPEPGGLWHG